MRVLSILALPVLPVLAISKTHGAPPALLSRYTASAGNKWTCLDGSQVIKWSEVNDDFCDCADGSDEPGTGACPNTSFFCANAGHIGASISSSRVRDGLCEEECCDGSDERPGVCPDRCASIGKVYAEKKAAEEKLRKTGSKHRSSYIAFAHREKARLEGLIAATEDTRVFHEQNLQKLKERAERAESISKESLDRKKKSPLYASLKAHADLLKRLQKIQSAQKDRIKELGEILDGLKGGYNPNYQDMAVLAAVRAWDTAKGVKLAATGNDDSSSVPTDSKEAESDNDSSSTEISSTEEEEEEDIQDWQINEVLDADHDSLLMEHDEFASLPSSSMGSSLLFDPKEYLPDSLIPRFEAIKIMILGFLGVSDTAAEQGSSPETTAARIAYQNADKAFREMETKLALDKQELARLFNPEYYGSEGEWRKLKDTCLKTDVGDYTYEVCLFGEAKQIPKNGGQTFSLGNFAKWQSPPSESKSLSAVQLYEEGTHCWNGPARSVILTLTCGVENAITNVAELQKCEYGVTGTSPALCLPPDVKTDREEL